jgi:hypothetical protein
VHKSLGVFVLIALGLAMVGCGSGSNSTNVNGNWSAKLTNSSDGSTAYTFNTTFSEMNNGSLTITNFSFTSNGTCFEGQTTQTGSFTLSGDFSGNVKGTFGLTVTSSTGNILTLQGGVGPNNTLTGNWSVTGSTACVGSGTFIFNRS